MKLKNLKRMALAAVALLATGSVSAATETYDFVIASESSTVLPTWGSEVTSGGVTMNMLASGSETFGNRFAVGPTNRNNEAGNCFKFRTAGDWKGLWSQYDDRNFTILNLVKGNRVTITISKDDATLKFVDGDAVVSGKTYTVQANGNLDFVSTGSVYIEKVVIDDPVAAEKVNVGVVGSDITYDFSTLNATPINQDESHTVSTGDNTLFYLAIEGNDFDNRFAIGPNTRTGTAGFYFRTASGTYKGLYSQWGDRNFSILNLEKGDKVTLTLSDNVETLKFVGGNVVVSGTEYTAEADGNMDFVTTGSVYIEKVRIVRPDNNVGGATLVSENALDFTDATIKAYVATTAAGGTVTFTQVNKVPANTPLYLAATTAISEDIPVLDGEAETISTNLLKGSATNSTSLTSTADTKYYVFGVLDETPGFYPVGTSNSLTSAAGKAYLQLTADQAASARSISMVFDDGETTGVSEELRAKSEEGATAVYDLQGRRINAEAARPHDACKARNSSLFTLHSSLKKGIYVINGKKILVK